MKLIDKTFQGICNPLYTTEYIEIHPIRQTFWDIFFVRLVKMMFFTPSLDFTKLFTEMIPCSQVHP